MAPGPEPSSFMGWTCGSRLTTFFSGIGWAVCCARWPGIKSVAARCAGLAVSWSCSVAFPMVFSACWPLVDVLGWAIAVALSILRWAAASGQRRVLTRGGKKFTLELYGPDVARPPDTALLRKAKSAREVARVVLCVGGEVAEVLADPQRCEAINRQGMVLGFGSVRQATSRRARRALQAAEKVHLCRTAGCAGGDLLHVGSFGVLAGNDEIDVREVLEGSGVGRAKEAPLPSLTCWCTRPRDGSARPLHAAAAAAGAVGRQRSGVDLPTPKVTPTTPRIDARPTTCAGRTRRGWPG